MTAGQTPKPASSSGASEIRKHYFLDKYVIIAPKRNLRPNELAARESSHKTETADSPPIENDPSIIEINGPDGHWAVKVVANKYPVVDRDFPQAYGVHELVIDTPEHNVEFSELPVDHIELVLEAYRRRITTLGRLKGIRYVYVFKNDGPKAGASLAHAHSQVIALPMIPPDVLAEAKAAQDYRSKHSHCPLCDCLEWEEQQRVRLVYQDKHIVAFAPYASDAGFAVWILPRTHHRRLQDLSADATHSLAVILKKLTSQLDNINLSFNFFIQESLPEAEDHLVIKLEPRFSTWAGLELGTGVIVNPVSPEYAAMWYRGEV